jgi:hypothetical protein
MTGKKRHIEAYDDDMAVIRYIIDRQRFRTNADVIHWLLKILNKYSKTEYGKSYWRYIDNGKRSPCQEESVATLPNNNS